MTVHSDDSKQYFTALSNLLRPKNSPRQTSDGRACIDTACVCTVYVIHIYVILYACVHDNINGKRLRWTYNIIYYAHETGPGKRPRPMCSVSHDGGVYAFRMTMGLGGECPVWEYNIALLLLLLLLYAPRVEERRRFLPPSMMCARPTRSDAPRDPIITTTILCIHTSWYIHIILFSSLFIIIINGHIITDKNLTAYTHRRG